MATQKVTSEVFATDKVKKQAQTKGLDPNLKFTTLIPQWLGGFDEELIDEFITLIAPTLKPKEGSFWDAFGPAESKAEALYRWMVKHYMDSVRASQRTDPTGNKAERREATKLVASLDKDQLSKVMELLQKTK